MHNALYSVYIIKCLINNKTYIGITTLSPPEKRWEQHKFKSQFGRCGLLSRAIKKYGPENFKFSVIDQTDSIEHLKELEKKYILEYNSYCNSDSSNGYNMTLGGDGVWGLKMTDESKTKMRESKIKLLSDAILGPEFIKKLQFARSKFSHSEESRKKISQALKGRAVRGRGWKMSEEQKIAISDSLKGKRLSDNCIKANVKRLSKKWRVTSPNGEVFIVENLRQFCRERELSAENLWKTSKGIIHQSQGWSCILIES